MRKVWLGTAWCVLALGGWSAAHAGTLVLDDAGTVLDRSQAAMEWDHINPRYGHRAHAEWIVNAQVNTAAIVGQQGRLVLRLDTPPSMPLAWQVQGDLPLGTRQAQNQEVVLFEGKMPSPAWRARFHLVAAADGRDVADTEDLVFHFLWITVP